MHWKVVISTGNFSKNNLKIKQLKQKNSCGTNFNLLYQLLRPQKQKNQRRTQIHATVFPTYSSPFTTHKVRLMIGLEFGSTWWQQWIGNQLGQ